MERVKRIKNKNRAYYAYLKEEIQYSRQRNLRANREKRKQHVEGSKGGKRINE
jgi:hypothetical protein